MHGIQHVVYLGVDEHAHQFRIRKQVAIRTDPLPQGGLAGKAGRGGVKDHTQVIHPQTVHRRHIIGLAQPTDLYLHAMASL